MGENESGNLTIVTKNVSNLIAGSIVGSVHWHALDCPHCPAFLGHRVMGWDGADQHQGALEIDQSKILTEYVKIIKK